MQRSAAALRHGCFLVLEKLLHWAIHPKLRARLMKLLGADVGGNARIYEVQLFNLENGFSNLHLGDDTHIGPGCRLDLASPLFIGSRAVLSPGVTVLTHNDPGSTEGSKLVRYYPVTRQPVRIGCDCWVGTNAILLAGSNVGEMAVVAAGSVVIGDVPPGVVVAGSPARVKKRVGEDSRRT